MWKRKRKKSEENIMRYKIMNEVFAHPDRKALEWMQRKPYEVRHADKKEKTQ